MHFCSVLNILANHLGGIMWTRWFQSKTPCKQPEKATPYNPMFITEILYCILGFLLDDSPPIGLLAQDYWGEDKDGYASVAALARTCRVLMDPSLDILWRKLYSLEPLIRYYELQGYDRTVPPTPEQWASVSQYASRVWEINIGGDSFPFLSTASAMDWPPGSFLLPNLKLLRFKPPIEKYTSLVLKLLTPTLVSFHGNLGVYRINPTEFDQFAVKFALICPHLRSIALQADVSPSMQDWCIQSRIRECFQNLHTVVCYHKNLEYAGILGPVESATFRQLAMSPSLVELIGVRLNAEQWQKHLASLPLDGTPFRNLRSLSLELEDEYFMGLELITELLRPWDQPLHTIMLRLKSLPLPDAVTGFLAALASAPRSHTLQTIALDSRSYSRPSSHPLHHWFVYGALCPLKSIQCLCELVIVLHGLIHITNDEFEDLVCHWPLLREFQLIPYLSTSLEKARLEPQDDMLTLRGLLPLITHCPKIHTLKLPVDAREVPVDSEIDANMRHPSITHLSFPISPISHVGGQDVAMFILKHFPSIVSLGAFGLNPESHWVDYESLVGGVPMHGGPWTQAKSLVHRHVDPKRRKQTGQHKTCQVPGSLQYFATPALYQRHRPASMH